MTIRSKIPHAARLLMGLIFTVFGLNGFLQFLPQPEMTGTAATFMGGLAAAGYFFPLLKSVEIAAGVMLLTNRFVPLALVILAPIVLNIFLFHAVLAPAGLGLAVLLVVLGLYLAWSYRDAFRSLLEAKHDAEPLTSSEPEASPAE